MQSLIACSSDYGDFGSPRGIAIWSPSDRHLMAMFSPRQIAIKSPFLFPVWILDVHGSGVLDARKQRLQLLSEGADVSVERADFEPAAPLRHLALALESNGTAPPSSRTRSDSNVAADDATRIDERRNA